LPEVNPRKQYETYNDALNECTTGADEQREICEIVLKKTKRFASQLDKKIIPVWETSSYSLIALLNPIIENLENKTVHVMDFGGACGAHYFHIRALMDNRIKLNWHVVETPVMVSIAKELETKELKFTSDLADAVNNLGRIDLLHTSGTLQCVDNPYNYLEELLKSKAKYILFNRLALNEIDRDVITIHPTKLSWHGIGELPEEYTDRWMKYPFTFLSEKTFINQLLKKYIIIAKFADKTGLIDIAGERITGYGLLCRKTDAS